MDVLCVRRWPSYDRSLGVRARVRTPGFLGVEDDQQHRRMDSPLWVRLISNLAFLMSDGRCVLFLVSACPTILGASATLSTTPALRT